MAKFPKIKRYDGQSFRESEEGGMTILALSFLLLRSSEHLG